MKKKNITLSVSDKIALIGNLATMLGSGIPLYEVVESLLEDTKAGQKIVLETLREDLTAGYSIHSSFAKFPKVFDSVAVNLISAAEEAGTLEETLKDLQKTMIKEREFADKVKSALFYPVTIIFVFMGVLGTLLVVVIPKISTVFSRLGVELPLPTRIMVAMSNIMTQHSKEFVFSIVALIGFAYIINKKYKGFLFNIFSSLPYVSGLMLKVDLTRFSRSMHLLLRSGLPITSVLELAQEVVNKRKLKKLINKARELSQEGHQFSSGLKTKDKIVPNMTIKLMAVGESTGTLEKAMMDIADNMDYEVSKSLKQFTTMLEPVMLVVVGLAVGGMMMAIISPIYGLISKVGAR